MRHTLHAFLMNRTNFHSKFRILGGSETPAKPRILLYTRLATLVFAVFFILCVIFSKFLILFMRLCSLISLALRFWGIDFIGLQSENEKSRCIKCGFQS